jgi:hypothetical protein
MSEPRQRAVAEPTPSATGAAGDPATAVPDVVPGTAETAAAAAAAATAAATTAPASASTAFKDQMDTFLKLSDQIDSCWRMFMTANVIILGAITANVIEKTIAVKALILFSYLVFLYMNYGALVDNYRGLGAVLGDLRGQIQSERGTPEYEYRKQFKRWIHDDLDYSNRHAVVRKIFATGIFFTAISLFGPDLVATARKLGALL